MYVIHVRVFKKSLVLCVNEVAWGIVRVHSFTCKKPMLTEELQSWL